jgi:hypothetical protein
MRKQYHLRRSARGAMAWDVDRRIELSEDLTPTDLLPPEIHEPDETFRFEAEGDEQTGVYPCRILGPFSKGGHCGDTDPLLE